MVVLDLDLEIKGRGARSFRRFDKDKPGLGTNFFWPYGPEFGVKIRGEPGFPGCLPWMCGQFGCQKCKISFLKNFCRVAKLSGAHKVVAEWQT